MQQSLLHSLLIAMPHLIDANFHHAVIYICSHDNEGAEGIIINKPLGAKLREVLEQLNISCSSEQILSKPVFSGGPVNQDRGFILHKPDTSWQNTITIGQELAITTSPDILRAIARGEVAEPLLIALGHVSWHKGQLEQELKDNIWLQAPFHPDLIFNMPIEVRWRAAGASIGVDVDKIVNISGNA